jgi:hypothetical protein
MGNESIDVWLMNQSIAARRSVLLSVFPPLPLASPRAILIISSQESLTLQGGLQMPLLKDTNKVLINNTVDEVLRWATHGTIRW